MIGWRSPTCLAVGTLVGQSSEPTAYPRSPSVAGDVDGDDECDVGDDVNVGVSVGVVRGVEVDVQPDDNATTAVSRSTRTLEPAARDAFTWPQ